MKKLIFVTGGVCSSLGKGVTASSLGCLLEARGLSVRMVKIDPCLNVDAGTMNPYQHGEVYVTDDGAETDLDLGNYARFTNAVADSPEVDVTIVEIGGTVGDMESIPFLEAARQLIHEAGKENAVSVHVTLVPRVSGGFGQRGILGMVRAARWARENRMPYFGICLGMQILVIEYARTVLGWADANSSEFDQETAHPVVSLLEEQVDVRNYGGTMRLGRSESVLKEGTRVREAYGTASIHERHRHRYEFSNAFRADLEKAGLRISALTPDGGLVESCEWPDHPWGVGVQFHPEFKSRPVAPRPLFAKFIGACTAYGGK
ncbi:MAG: gamma-glutamyl-gamma-aminobutyrate hydrolase family protein [Spirochaetes bacterium]|nr:gamma-glutamyl-gamma-aminobutyrate hydrolase family protein [Spirochaetota bacterium]